MQCKACHDDLQPANFGSPRKCAFSDFDKGYRFTEDNWNCATIEKLLNLDHEHIYGNDETMQVIPCPEGGWIVLTRYKQRGATSSAMHLGDSKPAILTLTFAERVLHAAAHSMA